MTTTTTTTAAESSENAVKKKCPICSSTFFNTHRLSIHIYKHHRNLLGSVHKPPTAEALRLNELQLRKLQSGGGLSSANTSTASAAYANDDEVEEGEEECEEDAYEDEGDFFDSEEKVF